VLDNGQCASLANIIPSTAPRGALQRGIGPDSGAGRRTGNLAPTMESRNGGRHPSILAAHHRRLDLLR
jgi:hypothetical protein